MLLELAEKVGYRLRREGVKGRTVQLKLRLGNFKTYTRSRTLPEATCYDEEIYHVAQALYRSLGICQGIRLLGISVSSFDCDAELSLFAEQTQKKERLYAAIDRIKDKFGERGITKAQLLRKNK